MTCLLISKTSMDLSFAFLSIKYFTSDGISSDLSRRGVSAYDVGTIGKPKSVIGPLKHGMLTKFGYHPVEARSGRHKALAKAIHKGGETPLAVFRRLQAVSILTKRMAPRASRIYKEDAHWVRVKYASKFKTEIKK